MLKVSDHELIKSCITQASNDEPQEIILTLEKLMLARPDLKQLHVALATAYIRDKKLKKAQKHLDIAKKKKLYTAHSLKLMQAKIYWEGGQETRALRLLRGSAGFASTPVEMNIAQLYAESYNFKEAEKIYHRIIEDDPDFLDAYMAYANILIKADKIDFALQVAEKALQLFPEDDSLRQLALNTYYLKGDFDRVDLEAQKIIDADPQAEYAIYLTVQSLWESGKSLEALKRIREHPEVLKSHPLLQVTEASILRGLGDVDGCRRVLAEIGRKNYKIPKVRWNCALLNLSCGHFAEGFKHYGLRFGVAQTAVEPRSFRVPEWDFRPLAPDQKLLLWREQGVGDVIAYMSLVSETGIPDHQLVFEVDQKLIPLVQQSFPGATVRPPKFDERYCSVDEDYHFHLPVGSLMPHYRHHDDDFDRQPQRYIQTDPETAAHYNKWLRGLSNKPKIGLCWRSSKNDGKRKKHYYTLNELNPLIQSVDATFVSLQYDIDDDERNAFFGETGQRIYRHPTLDQFDDLAGTAAFIDNLDFVVTVGTAVQNISGSLGKPTIVLGLKGSYMFFGRDTSSVFTQPIHPNSHVFGRTADEPKEPVIENAAAYLRSYFMFNRLSAAQ